jgi:hypothetical protein
MFFYAYPSRLVESMLALLGASLPTSYNSLCDKNQKPVDHSFAGKIIRSLLCVTVHGIPMSESD